MAEERLSAHAMSAAERERTERWFMEAVSGLTANLMILEFEIQDASFLDVEGLNREKGRLARLLAMVKRAEEEFFRQNGRELRAPDQATIDETVRLSTELGDRIAEERSAAAIVNLIGGLSNFVTRVLA